MKKNVLLVIILLLSVIFILGMGGKPASNNSSSNYTSAIDFTLKDLNGKDVTLSSYYGNKIVVLNFFATWCPPCREELPQLETFYNEYKDKGVEVIAVNLKGGKEEVKNFVEAYGLTFTILLDTKGDVGTEYAVRYIPSNFIINKEGKITYKGLYTPLDKLRSEIKKVL